MKRSLPTAILLFAVLAADTVSAAPPCAPPEYRVDELPTLGGNRTQGNSINDLGLIAGFSTYAGSGDRHATAWFFDRIYDLGTLGGPNSSVAWPVKNLFGRIVGISQTATLEPLGERWSCAAFFATNNTGYTCRGFVWEAGQMRQLPTLGGNNGFASGANSWGQVVGWAETEVFDPTCEGAGPGKSGQVLQFLPVVYGPGRDAIRALPLIEGDSSGAATAINDRGQVVGISGECDQAVGRRTAVHAVVWEQGRVIDIGAGTLTAPHWNTPTAINAHGEVVGFAGEDVGGAVTHAFIWTRAGGLRRLNPAPDDNSSAVAINRRGEVVGNFVSADGSLHGFVWSEDEGMRDLDALKQPEYPNVLTVATDINDFGVITGRATEPGTGNRTAFRAVPRSSCP